MNSKLPATVGVPVIVFVPRVSPGGKAPEVIERIFVPTPPDTPKIFEYAVPTKPVGTTAGSIVIVGHEIWIA